jgi:hypothetical protein
MIVAMCVLRPVNVRSQCTRQTWQHAVSLHSTNMATCSELALDMAHMHMKIWDSSVLHGLICNDGSYVLPDSSLGQLSGLMLLFVQR